MTTTTIHPIFDECKAAPEYVGRYATGESWVTGGYRWATDGRIVVRVPSDEPNSPPPKVKAGAWPPTMSLGWDRSAWDEAPTALPVLTEDDRWEPCAGCSGDGKTHRVRCEDCHGTGEVECDCGFEHPCGCDDGWDGEESDDPCPECKGAGKQKREAHGLPVGEANVGVRYLDILIRHGATVYVHKSMNAHEKPLYFTIPGGFDGQVMPRRRTK